MPQSISTIIGKGEIFFPEILNGYGTHQQSMTLTAGIDTIALQEGDKFRELISVTNKRWQIAFETAGMNPTVLASLQGSTFGSGDVLNAKKERRSGSDVVAVVGGGTPIATPRIVRKGDNAL